MKRVPDLTQIEFETLCACMDMTLRATGLQHLQAIAALDRKLGQVEDLPDPQPDAAGGA